MGGGCSLAILDDDGLPKLRSYGSNPMKRRSNAIKITCDLIFKVVGEAEYGTRSSAVSR